MSGSSLLLEYLVSCFGGALPASECGPAWHFTIIGVLVVAGIVVLVRMRIRAGRQRGGEDD